MLFRSAFPFHTRISTHSLFPTARMSSSEMLNCSYEQGSPLWFFTADQDVDLPVGMPTGLSVLAKNDLEEYIALYHMGVSWGSESIESRSCRYSSAPPYVRPISVFPIAVQVPII